jgi:hypothetical protein
MYDRYQDAWGEYGVKHNAYIPIEK